MLEATVQIAPRAARWATDIPENVRCPRPAVYGDGTAVALLSVMLARMLLLAALIPACRAAEARNESRATLTGTAQFPGDLPTTRSGTVQMTVRGLGDISDSCKGSGEQQFVATYSGALTVDPAGRFTAPLYPNGVMVGNNCAAQDIRIEQISSITLGAQLGDEVGAGELTFQNLAAVDGDELKAGAFDELNGSLTFTRQ